MRKILTLLLLFFLSQHVFALPYHTKCYPQKHCKRKLKRIIEKKISESKNPKDVKDSDSKDDLTFIGILDVSYNYLRNSKYFISDIPNRYNDTNENGFSLQQINITIAHEPKQGLGGLFNFIIGRDAIPAASYGFNPDFGIQNIGFSLQQLYLQYAIRKATFF